MRESETDWHYLNGYYARFAISMVVFPTVDLTQEVCVREEANTDAVDEENGKPRFGFVWAVPVRDGPRRRRMGRQQR